MTRIQSSTGLITGIPIQETVDKLMLVAAQPKTTLTNRTKALESQKLAVTQLTSLLVALQFETRQLGAASLFESRQATTSDPALAASISPNGAPAAGSYLFTPIQTASAQQLLSQSFAANAVIGPGTISFSKGGFVDAGISLNELNAGGGVERGKIRITDRSGASAIIDLGFARTVDDVLDAINKNTSISVKAAAAGDSFKLTDTSGGSGNLKIQEVAGGSTAAHLGLAGIDAAASSATGGDVFALHAKTSLAFLNDGTGVQLRGGNDLSVSLADETTVSIDLGTAKTLGDVIAAINAAAPVKISAAISSDGNRLELQDLTAGDGTFAVSNVGGGTAASDLGLTKTAIGDTITGRRLVSGLKDTLVSSLKGGAGLGTLGQIDITNRNNVTSQVDLSAAETLGSIVAAINDQAVGVSAAINSARNGIQLADTTGGAANNFIIADGDASNSATTLGIVANSSATTVNSGGLRRKQISAATLLSSLNGGAGIDIGDFRITGTNGVTKAVDLDKVGDVATTIGDVIARINALDGVGVEARINERGDGIILVDTAGGSGKITVTAVGGDTTAADLRLLGTSIETIVDGVPKQAIDGSATATVNLDADDKLSDVVTKINALNRGVTASILNDGVRQRLSLAVNDSGAANELLIDTGDTALTLQTISSGRDALVIFGSNDSGGAVISSSTNTFQNVVAGLDLSITKGSLEPVTVTVKASTSSLVSNVKEFVAAYNSIRTTLDSVTAFDAEELTTGILFGTSEALRVDRDLSYALTSRFFGVGQFESLASIGIRVDDKGKLSLDEAKLTAAYNKDPDALKKLFTDSQRGFAAKLDSVIESLAAKDSSLLAARVESLTRTIESNTRRIDEMTSRLERQRERLLLEFYSIESTVAKMQDNLAALSALQIIPPLTSTRNSSR